MGEKQEMEFEALAKLYQASTETLQGILKYNKVVREPEKLDKMGAVKAILAWLDEAEQTTDGNFTVLLLLNDSLTPRKIKAENIPEKTQTAGTKSGASPTVEPKHKHPTICTKDFKISGEISDRPTRLSFVSLVRQIEAGLRKSYSEADIIDGVTRAISPSLPLRSYLEGRENLSLSSLRKILRSHYEEKSATELYTQLTNSTQGRDEPQDFLLKLLSLKQKVLFISKEEGADAQYDEKLVVPVFQHTLYLGLHDETLRREVKPILDSKVEDDELIQQFSTIVAREKERKGRLVKAKVNAVTEAVPNSPKKESKQKSDVKEGILWAELQELRAEIAEIKRQSPRASKSSSETDDRFQMGCEACRQSNTGFSCTHCWVCGSEDHYKAGCKQRRRSGNGRGSRRGSRQ